MVVSRIYLKSFLFYIFSFYLHFAFFFSFICIQSHHFFSMFVNTNNIITAFNFCSVFGVCVLERDITCVCDDIYIYFHHHYHHHIKIRSKGLYFIPFHSYGGDDDDDREGYLISGLKLKNFSHFFLLFGRCIFSSERN